MIKTSGLCFLLLMFIGCGKLKESLNNMAKNPLSPASGVQPGAVNSASFTPGSYFKVVKEVGSAKDTRVHEFQYLSSGKFIYTQTSFPGGNLSTSTFHKKTGTFKEISGTISHVTTYDSCNVRTPHVIAISGDRNNVVTVYWGGNTLKLTSYASWSLPADISAKIPDSTEDVGCVVFKD